MLGSDHQKVLGLDIGANSIGFALLKLDEQKDETLFEELTSNSIVFSNPDKAEVVKFHHVVPFLLKQ
jgi:CRISPR/Cas system Type II protein with McrA/HNH and RuvC-like nuclease domain